MPRRSKTNSQMQAARNRPKRFNKKLKAGPIKRRAFAGLELTQSYVNSLQNPFDFEGVKLGWGCLVPSQCAVAYARGTVNANADGSLALIAMPQSSSLLYTKPAGAAVATTGGAAAIDSAAVGANYGSGRVISIGIRAFPSIAATSAPGVSYAGALEGVSETEIKAMTPNDFAAFPQSHIGIASAGCIATGRPVDASSFIFAEPVVATNVADNWSSANYTDESLPFSVPYLAFSGLPASAAVFYEVIMNFEGLQQTTHLSAGLGQSTQLGDTLAKTWGSFEQMWNYVKPILGPVAKNFITGTLAPAAAAYFTGGSTNALAAAANAKLPNMQNAFLKYATAAA